MAVSTSRLALRETGGSCLGLPACADPERGNDDLESRNGEPRRTLAWTLRASQRRSG